MGLRLTILMIAMVAVIANADPSHAFRSGGDAVGVKRFTTGNPPILREKDGGPCPSSLPFGEVNVIRNPLTDIKPGCILVFSRSAEFSPDSANRALNGNIQTALVGKIGNQLGFLYPPFENHPGGLSTNFSGMGPYHVMCSRDPRVNQVQARLYYALADELKSGRKIPRAVAPFVDDFSEQPEKFQAYYKAFIKDLAIPAGGLADFSSGGGLLGFRLSGAQFKKGESILRNIAGLRKADEIDAVADRMADASDKDDIRDYARALWEVISRVPQGQRSEYVDRLAHEGGTPSPGSAWMPVGVVGGALRGVESASSPITQASNVVSPNDFLLSSKDSDGPYDYLGTVLGGGCEVHRPVEVVAEAPKADAKKPVRPRPIYRGMQEIEDEASANSTSPTTLKFQSIEGQIAPDLRAPTQVP